MAGKEYTGIGNFNQVKACKILLHGCFNGIIGDFRLSCHHILMAEYDAYLDGEHSKVSSGE